MNDNYRGRWVWNKTYRYGRYRCSFNVAKGPAICPNSISIRQEVLDAKLLDKFRAALIPDMIEYLAGATNQVLQDSMARRHAKSRPWLRNGRSSSAS